MQALAPQAVHLLPGSTWHEASQGTALYSHDGLTLAINRYLPSVLCWAEQGLLLRQLGSFPGATSPRLLVQQAPYKRLTLRLRHPEGASQATVKVNGRRRATSREPGSSMDIARHWRSGDHVVLELVTHQTQV